MFGLHQHAINTQVHSVGPFPPPLYSHLRHVLDNDLDDTLALAHDLDDEYFIYRRLGGKQRFKCRVSPDTEKVHECATRYA